jgi:hypothetical protein
VPVEKWKRHFIEEIIKLALPQVLWKTCGKICRLWKKKTIRHLFPQFPQARFSSACGKVENFV